MPRLRANGVELSYTETGAGIPLIFIHGGFGGPQSTLGLRNSLIGAAVPDAYRLVDWDRRCAGASEYVLDWYTLDDVAADARALLAGLGIDRSVVIGSSMGGMVAQQYVLDYPEHTIALALLNTGPDLMLRTGWGKSMTALAARARSEGDEAVFNGERLRNPPELPARAQIPESRREALLAARKAYLARVAETPDQELLRLASGATRNYAAFAGYDFGPRLGEIDVPTFVLHGTADTTVPWECAELLHAGIRDAVLCPIPGAEHGILQQPAARDALRAWLDELRPALAPRVE